MIADAFKLVSGVARTKNNASTTPTILAPGMVSKLLSALGLSEHLFPPSFLQGHAWAIRPALATELVCRDQVIAGCSDTAVAVAPCRRSELNDRTDPLHAPSWAYLSSGTWLIGIELVVPLINDRCRN
jgi:hypothetical protein